MGYGIKNNINLDLTYNEIIKPCIIRNGLLPYPLYKEDQYNAYRCDEISGSGLIDYKFVTCLSEADIVIADISTMNINAIYELGARHALKPRSTILLCAKEEGHRFNFFDITYVPIVFYTHEGAHIDAESIKTTQNALDKFLEFAINSDSTIPDNPIQRALNERNTYQTFIPPEQQTLYQLYIDGRKSLDDGEFDKAFKILSTLYSQDPTEENLLLMTLAQYKVAEAAHSSRGLIDCIEQITSKVNVDASTSEHLHGRIAAIYLRLYNLLGEDTYYYLALESYRRGANYSKINFYCPRNYCALLLRIYEITDDSNILSEYYYTAKHYAKLYLNSTANAANKGNYEERVYYYYNVCDMKAIIAGEYLNYEKVMKRLESDDGISIRQRATIIEGLEKIKCDISEMNQRTKLS